MVRHLLAEVRANRLSAQAAALELNIHPSRLCQLRTDYLRACAQGFGDTWVPGTSDGDHHSDWPVAVVSLLTKLLQPSPFIAASPRSTVVGCLRPDGDVLYLRDAPDPKSKPIVLRHCPVF